MKLLAEQTPATFVAFDLLAVGGESLLEPSVRRAPRATRATSPAPLPAPIQLTRTTTDVDLARRWLVEFEGAGLDGVVAKPLASPYAPNKRTMLKIKHHRTADVVALGYRIHASGRGVGSLLLGLYDDDGELRNVGGVSAFSDARRLELIDELAPLVERDDDGDAVKGETERSRFSSGKDVSFVRLRPERVLEVRYDQMEGMRFRHTAQFERWRPDREAPLVHLRPARPPDRLRPGRRPALTAPGRARLTPSERGSLLLRAARLHARRLPGHLRVVGRERQLAEPVVEVALPPAEQLVDAAGLRRRTSPTDRRPSRAGRARSRS